MAKFEKDVSAIETGHNVWYDRRKPIDTLSAVELGRTFASMGTEGRVVMARQEIARANERPTGLMMGALRKSDDLKVALAVLEREDMLRQRAK